MKIFKTDLWDEAKNTRILLWASEQGAIAFGSDIAPATTMQAKRNFSARGCSLAGSVSDVRQLPYANASFDVVYSMGTIEHFEETRETVGELLRVLKPGGRAIIGLPNRWDPFLRPLMVVLLRYMGLYAYGFEKSFSRKALREMCEQAGFEVLAETGILFLPGWLRILDLAFWVWCRPLVR